MNFSNVWFPLMHAGVFALSIFYSSILEWVLHLHVMHHPVGSFTYPFRQHALVHHGIFRADPSYHLRKEEDKHTIPMAWWNGPVLVLIATLPVGILSIVAKIIFGMWIPWTLVATLSFGVACYYCVYEYIHWCMHLPRKRNIERTGIFFRLNGHHVLHHRYMNRYNFNVVLPFADWLFGTLLRRSKVSFQQVRGPSVPDVQPLQADQLVTAQ